MKVIFLDIDGVLNCANTPNPRKFPYVVDKRLLTRLQRLLKRTGAKAVLSSSWRLDPVGLFAAKHWAVPFIDVCPDKPRSPRDPGLACPIIRRLPATQSSMTRTTNWMSSRFFSRQHRPA
jgi:hypothetical protein